MPVPLLDLRSQYAAIREEIRDALDRVIDSQLFILGEEVAALETEVAAYCKCPFAVGVSSGTDALLVALMALGVKPGDEVITSPYSFFATAGCIARLGAKPVFVDIDPTTFNINPDLIPPLINERTRAIIPVHLFGQMADMEPITEAAKPHGIAVIEDAAQAIGAEYKNRRAGSVGDFGCFSFFPSKNLGGFGDGGLVTCHDPAFSERLKLLRNHGYKMKYHSQLVGGNFRLDAIQAAVLRVKLKYLDAWTTLRRKIAERYRHLFAESTLADSSSSAEAHVVLPVEVPNRSHVYNQFVVRVSHRDELLSFLKSRGIGSAVYYPVSLHEQECFSELGYSTGDFPISEQMSKTTLALPIFPELTTSQQETVVSAIAEFYGMR